MLQLPGFGPAACFTLPRPPSPTSTHLCTTFLSIHLGNAARSTLPRPYQNPHTYAPRVLSIHELIAHKGAHVSCACI